MDYLERMNSNDDLEEEEDQSVSMEERLQVNLQTNRLGPRPLRNPERVQIPPAVLRPSSCEYLLEQSTTATMASRTETNYSSKLQTSIVHKKSSEMMNTLESQSTMTVQATLVHSTTMKVAQTSQNAKRSSTSTTINNEKSTTSKSTSGDYGKCTDNTNVPTEKVIPPPPPPRRLLLTTNNAPTTTNGLRTPKAPEPQRKYFGFADDGFFAVVGNMDGNTDASGNITNIKQTTLMTATPTTMTQSSIHRKEVASAGVASVASITKATTAKHQSSSTIIETCLLGQVVSQKSRSLTTALTKNMNALPPMQQQGAQTLVTKNKQSPSTASTHEDIKSVAGFRLSPRLEMRLALNHDILDDEDLICYDPGPDLTTILGHDLSTFQRLTGRDLSNRSATNRVQPKEAVISYSQQRNSKMDTPTVNRRPRPTGDSTQSQSTSLISLASGGGSARVGGAPQHPQPNRNTWSSSAYVDQISDEHASSGVGKKSNSCYRNENKLGDLEILSKRERIYCMSQSKSGSLVKTAMATTKSKYFSPNDPHQLTRAPSTTSMGAETELGSIVDANRRIDRDETAHVEKTKSVRLLNFIKRRNSEISVSSNCSQSSLSDSNVHNTSLHSISKQMAQMSPRKDNDRPSLNRRLWKQITKRRRANSPSDIVTS